MWDDGWYFGKDEREAHGNLVSERLAGMEVSKRVDMADMPGGLAYEAERIGIDMFELLRCLEGMCRNGEAVELPPGDSYLVR